VGGVAVALGREAKTLEPGAARLLLLCLCLFLAFEWAAHLIGSRVSRSNYPQADRAAFAALSSAGIWIILLATFPTVLQGMGLDPLGAFGISLMVVASASGLCVRLWFLREIYETSFERAAGLWAVSRGAAALLVGGAATLWFLSGAVGRAGLPLLSMGP
jgi:hypothetical protein